MRHPGTSSSFSDGRRKIQRKILRGEPFRDFRICKQMNIGGFRRRESRKNARVNAERSESLFAAKSEAMEPVHIEHGRFARAVRKVKTGTREARRFTTSTAPLVRAAAQVERSIQGRIRLRGPAKLKRLLFKFQI